MDIDEYLHCIGKKTENTFNFLKEEFGDTASILFKTFIKATETDIDVSEAMEFFKAMETISERLKMYKTLLSTSLSG